MKKHIMIMTIVLCFLLALSVGPAAAAKKGKSGGGGPVDKGSFMFGGDVNLTIATGSMTLEPDEGDDIDTDTFSFGIDALAGYYVINGLEVGGLLIIESESEEDDDQKETDTTWALAPQVGYFYQFSDKFSVFGMLPIGYMKTTNKVEPDAKNAKDTETETGGFFFEPRGGIVYHLTDNLGFTASLYFRYMSGEGSRDNGNKDVDFDVKSSELGLRVGLLCFL